MSEWARTDHAFIDGFGHLFKFETCSKCPFFHFDVRALISVLARNMKLLPRATAVAVSGHGSEA